MMRTLIPALGLALLASLPLRAETVQIATFDVGLERDGPGLLLNELASRPTPQAEAVVQVIQTVRPDILLLVRFDHDRNGRALDAFRALLAKGSGAGAAPIDYPYRFDATVNAGVPSGFDLDGDGRSMRAEDAFGWGRFPGAGGMAILSRLPIDAEAARTFTTFLWRDLPGADLPKQPDGNPFPDAERQAVLRLSSRAHWQVPVLLPGGSRLALLASNPTPPLRDKGEGFNLRRNQDEVRFWSVYLGGSALRDDQGRSEGPPAGPVVLLGNLNLDPFDGRGNHAAIAALLADPRLQDPRPAGRGGAAAAHEGANARQVGPPALDTGDWAEEKGPGNLRTDYVLPSADLRVSNSGVFWPEPGTPLAEVATTASRHRLVWVDLELP